MAAEEPYCGANHEVWFLCTLIMLLSVLLLMLANVFSSNFSAYFKLFQIALDVILVHVPWMVLGLEQHQQEGASSVQTTSEMVKTLLIVWQV